MPLWEIFHPDTVFTDVEEKQALSKAISAVYEAVPLPAFYVDVLFIPLPQGSIFRGGEVQPSDTKPPFIRMKFHNIARTMPPGRGPHKTGFLSRIDAALKPFIHDKGWDYEYHGLEPDPSLAKIQGFEFPAPGTELELLWIKENKPIGPDEAREQGLVST